MWTVTIEEQEWRAPDVHTAWTIYDAARAAGRLGVDIREEHADPVRVLEDVADHLEVEPDDLPEAAETRGLPALHRALGDDLCVDGADGVPDGEDAEAWARWIRAIVARADTAETLLEIVRDALEPYADRPRPHVTSGLEAWEDWAEALAGRLREGDDGRVEALEAEVASLREELARAKGAAAKERARGESLARHVRQTADLAACAAETWEREGARLVAVEIPERDT